MYLVINLTIVDMFVGGIFSLFSICNLTLLKRHCAISALNPGTDDTNNWLFLRLVSSDLSCKHCSNFIGSDACNNSSLYSPYASPLLIKKWVYGVTIAVLVWVLPAMFIILILKNRMFNQSPIFSTSSGPLVFSCGSLGHPKTGFCEIAVRRSTYYLEISIARKKLKIHGWMYHSSQFFEVFSPLTSLIVVGNGIFTFHLSSHIWSSFSKMDYL